MDKVNKLLTTIKGKSGGTEITNEIPQHYQYIENFDLSNEDECLKLDNKNKEIYKHNNDLYKRISDKLKRENAMIKIETPPSPPTQPNNYERYMMHKTRNVAKNVRHQSFAVNYLLQKGYKLCINSKTSEENNFDSKYALVFEPYEAIEIVERLENTSIDNLIKINSSNLRRSISVSYEGYPAPSAPPITTSTSLYNIPLSTSLPTNFQTNSSVNIANALQHTNSYPQITPSENISPPYYYKKE